VTYRLSYNKNIILQWKSEREDIVKFEIVAKDPSGKVVKEQTAREKMIELTGLDEDVLYSFQVVAVDVASQKSKPAVITMIGKKFYINPKAFFKKTDFHLRQF